MCFALYSRSQWTLTIARCSKSAFSHTSTVNQQPNPNNSIFNYLLTLFLLNPMAIFFVRASTVSSLNYSISLLTGLLVSSLDLLQSIGHIAALVIFLNRKVDHIIPLFKTFQWSPQTFNIKLWFLSVIYKAFPDLIPPFSLGSLLWFAFILTNPSTSPSPQYGLGAYVLQSYSITLCAVTALITWYCH